MITKQDIEKLFGAQLAKIQDAGLRAKTVEVWVEGAKRGGYQSVDQLTKMPFTLLTNARGVNFIEHTIAVTEGALALARSQEAAYRALPYKIDFDRLVAGGLLHDVGKLVEIEPDGAGGYRKSHNGKCLVGAAGMPDEMVNVVACHAKEGEGRPQVIETVFIHQADFATFDPLVMMEKGSLIQ
jgi:hypothetical protein